MSAIHRGQRGISIMETTAAIALVGFAILAASNLLGVHPRCVERLDVQQQLLRALEATVEKVRAGAIPVEEGRTTISTGTPRVELVIRTTATPGVWQVQATATGSVRQEVVTSRLTTLVWRPS